MYFYNEAGLVNFVCIVFEQGVKMLTLSSMENLIVEYNLILIEVGIQNLVCECILGWRSVLSHFLVTVTLTSDLLSRIGIQSGAYLLYSLR